MINAVDHINIVVSDLERSLDFYQNLLGFRLVRRAHLHGEWIEHIVGFENVSAKVAYIVSEGGEPRLELLQYVFPKGKLLTENALPNTIGLRHLAFRVKDIHRAAEKLKAAGIPLFSEPVSVPTQVVSHEAGQKTLLYFRDPDGVILELAQYA